jgi:integrase
MPNGKRVRKHFKEKKQAAAHARALNNQFALEGVEGVHFGAEARAAFSSAKTRLGEAGADLASAVEFYLAHHARGPAMGFREAVDALIKAKAGANRRPRTLAVIRQRLLSYRYHAAVDKVSDVTADNVAAFVNRPNLAARSRYGYRVALVQFCKFCRQRGWMAGNPLESVEAPTLDAVRTKVLTPDQAARLMAAAVRVANGRAVRVIALGLLAGLRPSEIAALNEADIRGAVIRVGSGKMRGKRAQRIVPISPVLRSWLDLYADRPLLPKNWAKIRRAIVALAGLRAVWCQDILRKTWISYRLAEIGDEKQLSREAGNSPDVIYRHYFDLIEAGEARRFGAYSVITSLA